MNEIEASSFSPKIVRVMESGLLSPDVKGIKALLSDAYYLLWDFLIEIEADEEKN